MKITTVSSRRITKTEEENCVTFLSTNRLSSTQNWWKNQLRKTMPECYKILSCQKHCHLKTFWQLKARERPIKNQKFLKIVIRKWWKFWKMTLNRLHSKSRAFLNEWSKFVPLGTEKTKKLRVTLFGPQINRGSWREILRMFAGRLCSNIKTIVDRFGMSQKRWFQRDRLLGQALTTSPQTDSTRVLQQNLLQQEQLLAVKIWEEMSQ